MRGRLLRLTMSAKLGRADCKGLKEDARKQTNIGD